MTVTAASQAFLLSVALFYLNPFFAYGASSRARGLFHHLISLYEMLNFRGFAIATGHSALSYGELRGIYHGESLLDGWQRLKS